MPKPSVSIVEVGTRDGFQIEKTFIPTETKISVINAICHAGVRRIEATSFVSPKVIPQLRDAAEVMAAIDRIPGVTYIALIPNLKGAERAVAAGVDAVKTVICTNDRYNLRNVGLTVEESIQQCGAILAFAHAKAISAEVVIGSSFGCPLEGPVPASRVADLTGRLAALGYTNISIADSMGLANPAQVRHLARSLQDQYPHVRFSLHVHNTRGLGLANIYAAWEEGFDEFDSSIGGLGGSDVVVGGATGNVSTEDLVNMFEEMGVNTGVNIEQLLQATRMAQRTLGRNLTSYVLNNGTPSQFYTRTQAAEVSRSSPVK